MTTRLSIPIGRATARQLLVHLIEQGDMIMSHLAGLQAEVERNRHVVESAVVLITGISEKLQELKEDPAAIQALADELKASSDNLAAAVQANTPAPDVPQA